MKPSNLLIIGSLIMPLISTCSKAETIIIETGNGTRVETNSEGRVNISTSKQKINYSDDSNIQKNDQESNSNRSFSSGTTCYQENLQSVKVEGSNQTVVRSSSSNCY